METFGQLTRSVPYGQASHSETGENDEAQYPTDRLSTNEGGENNSCIICKLLVNKASCKQHLFLANEVPLLSKLKILEHLVHISEYH